ncbi:MAG: hypothetical protein ACR2NR_02840 [Solirubrobacteraceae bacterium]
MSTRDLVEALELERIGDRGQRIGIAHVSGDVLAGRLAEQRKRSGQVLARRLPAGHLRIDNSMQALRGGGHDQMEVDRTPLSTGLDGHRERRVRGGSVGDEEHTWTGHHDRFLVSIATRILAPVAFSSHRSSPRLHKRPSMPRGKK